MDDARGNVRMMRLKALLRRSPWLVRKAGTIRDYLGLARMQVFSIAMYRGDQPWSVQPIAGRRAGVLTRRDVTDVPAAFVADPFLHRTDAGWFMFFEVLRADTWRGEIAVATSTDGLRWRYGSVVLAEPFHLSYPYVFGWGGETYMIPETFEVEAVRLYRAVKFPTRWTLECELLTGRMFADASPFHHGDRWWVLVEASHKEHGSEGGPTHDTLRLYSAPVLTGPWTEHPKSPVVEADKRIARPAGRVVTADGRLIRFAQESSDVYGVHVHALEIEELTPTEYRERPLGDRPILGPGRQHWNRSGMHHIDAHPVDGGWLASVDGWSMQPLPRLQPVPKRVESSRERRPIGARNLLER